MIENPDTKYSNVQKEDKGAFKQRKKEFGDYIERMITQASR
jgi:hypothetical protein